VRTYTWRRYQDCTIECYERQAAEGCTCGLASGCVCDAEGQVVGGPCCRCTAVGAEVGARAAAGENGR
jgi:hypothetical protein